MATDTNQYNEQLSKKATEKDASLLNNEQKPLNANNISDRDSSALNDQMTQNVSTHREVKPEFGDAADPTMEELGLHHRDE